MGKGSNGRGRDPERVTRASIHMVSRPTKSFVASAPRVGIPKRTARFFFVDFVASAGPRVIRAPLARSVLLLFHPVAVHSVLPYFKRTRQDRSEVVCTTTERTLRAKTPESPRLVTSQDRRSSGGPLGPARAPRGGYFCRTVRSIEGIKAISRIMT